MRRNFPWVAFAAGEKRLTVIRVGIEMASAAPSSASTPERRENEKQKQRAKWAHGAPHERFFAPE